MVREKPLFAKIKDNYGFASLININNVACVFEESNTIVLCGNHGNGDGIIHTDKEGIKLILSMILIMDGNGNIT